MLGRALGLLALAVLAWQVFSRGLDFSRAGAALRFLDGVLTHAEALGTLTLAAGITAILCALGLLALDLCLAWTRAASTKP